MDLRDLGWREFFARQFAGHEAEGRRPCRVARQEMEHYLLCGSEGDFDAEVSGRLRLDAAQGGAWPAVGDWVAASLRPEEGRATIHAVLDRQTRFSRSVASNRKAAAGAIVEQVVAANVDWV
ncbi:MAG TPA: ribosome small subunit-dependent GTPase, partial [Candidatus Brocadiia bacterium]|nr:ribosome small subunit-dependent GTPase [Candidatus Brocadiia bacterium]